MQNIHRSIVVPVVVARVCIGLPGFFPGAPNRAALVSCCPTDGAVVADLRSCIDVRVVSELLGYVARIVVYIAGRYV